MHATVDTQLEDMPTTFHYTIHVRPLTLLTFQHYQIFNTLQPHYYTLCYYANSDTTRERHGSQFFSNLQ